MIRGVLEGAMVVMVWRWGAGEGCEGGNGAGVGEVVGEVGIEQV